jgi:hypothetical protein
VRQIAEACGWLGELEELWAKTARAAEPKEADEPEVKRDRDEALNEEIEKLTKEVDETLHLSKWHEERVRSEKLPGEKMAGEKASPSSPNTLVQQASPNDLTTAGPQKQDKEDGDLSHVYVTRSTEEKTAEANPALNHARTEDVALPGGGDGKKEE